MEYIILALKVILLGRLQGIICSGIQEPYLLGVVMLGRDRCPRAPAHQTFICCVCVCVCLSRGYIVRPRPYVSIVGLHLRQGGASIRWIRQCIATQ